MRFNINITRENSIHHVEKKKRAKDIKTVDKEEYIVSVSNRLQCRITRTESKNKKQKFGTLRGTLFM